MTHEELKEKILCWKKMVKEKEEINGKIKEIEAEINEEVKKQMDENNVNIIKNPLFTIERSTKTEKEIDLPKVISNLEAKKFLFAYIENGGNVKIGASKTFEKQYVKAGLSGFDELCKIKKTEKISYEVRPDIPTEDKMEI